MIPPFDFNGVLPPHLGDPTRRSDLSPYPATTLELVSQFATSAKRKEILQGFLDFRAALHKQGFAGAEAFQWVDGSFLENIETTEGRPPGDIDVLTLYWGANIPVALTTLTNLPEFFDRRQSKAKFHVDHFPLNIGAGPQATVENVRYWIQLFTHRRDGIWKGMLRLPLDDDKSAQAVLTPAPPL